MRIALLELVDEFDALEAYAAGQGLGLADFRIVAFEPLIRARLAERGIACESTLPYWRSGADGSHEAIIRSQEPAMRLIRERMHFVDGRGVTVAYANELANYVRPFLGHLFKLTEIIWAIVDANPDAELYAAVGHGCASSALIGHDERYLGRVAERVADARGVRFVGTARMPEPEGNPVARRHASVLDRIAVSIALWGLRRRRAVIVPRGSGPFAALLPRIFAADPSLVFVGVDARATAMRLIAGNVLGMLAPLRGRPRVRTLDTRAIPAGAAAAEVESLREAIDAVFRSAPEDATTYRGIGFADILAQKVQVGVAESLVSMLHDSCALEVVFEKAPRSAVMSYAALDRMAVAGELAKVTGRRSLFVSHGSHPAPVSAEHALELGSFSRAFMLAEFTDAALANPVQQAHLEYFDEHMDDLSAAGVKTGPLVFATADRNRAGDARRALGLPTDGLVVTHAATLKNRRSERFLFLETLDEFFASLAEVIEWAAGAPDMRLLVRVHPGFEMTDAQMRAILPEGDYVISRSGPFVNVLEATDILLSYSSTAIDEALLNRVPVVLYDPWGRYDHFRTPPFAGDGVCWPVCYVDDREMLAPAVAEVASRLASGSPQDDDLDPYVYRKPYFGNLLAYLDEATGETRSA